MCLNTHPAGRRPGGCLPCRRIRRLAKSPGPKSEAEDETDPVHRGSTEPKPPECGPGIENNVIATEVHSAAITHG